MLAGTLHAQTAHTVSILILDGKTGGFEPRVVKLVGDMQTLARAIEARRRRGVACSKLNLV